MPAWSAVTENSRSSARNRTFTTFTANGATAVTMPTASSPVKLSRDTRKLPMLLPWTPPSLLLPRTITPLVEPASRTRRLESASTATRPPVWSVYGGGDSSLGVTVYCAVRRPGVGRFRLNGNSTVSPSLMAAEVVAKETTIGSSSFTM